MEFIDNWFITATLGEGAFGEVKLLQHKSSKESLALKILHFRGNNTKSEIESMVSKEIKIHKQLKHENVIKFYGARFEKEVWYIFLEYADGGELYDRIDPEVGLIPHTKTSNYFKQIITGVTYLHSLGIAHRDLKPENILISRDVVKISDFGFATCYRNEEKVERLLDTKCGTPPYLAPEVLQGKSYKAEGVDVWSCGIILCAMVAGELPWDRADSTSPEYKAWRESTPNTTPWTKFDLSTLNFFKRLLCPLPSKRITLQQITDHQWMRKNTSNKRKLDVQLDATTPPATIVKKPRTDSQISRLCSLSQPDPVLENINYANNEREVHFAFSQPAQNESFLEEPLRAKLVHRMTRFFVRINAESCVTLVTKLLDEFCYQWKVFKEARNVNVITISTTDKRKTALIFKATIIEIDQKTENLVLLDFRLSRGDGLEFKRHFLRLKSHLHEVELKGIGRGCLEWLV